VCGPGRALGADDLKKWAFRRQRGLTGADGPRERAEADAWRNGELLPRGRSRRMRAKIARGLL
jgi:hypothetical protein